ncbi:hypothetical protein DFH08DRAFT_718937, partial [Mycena albidolilacea]
FAQLRAQWTNPTDVLTILTVISGDIGQNALAQLCSSHPHYFTPVALAFGRVAYAFSTILSAIRLRRLPPDPEIACTLIDVGSNYSRDVHSRVLLCLVRDYELPAGNSHGLTVSFYRTLWNKAMGVLDCDWVYWSGVTVIVLQLGIATIPGVLNGDWVIFILTFRGIILIQLQASLPQWRKELCAGRNIKENKPAVVWLTRGNGSLYAMVIRSHGCGISMADMATGREMKDRITIPGTLILAILWLIHLSCTSGLQNDSWYSLLIGVFGMLQNALASGARRSPGALGIHLEEKVKHIHKENVFNMLVEAEEKNFGILLTDVYFPGGLRPEEETWKKGKITEYANANAQPASSGQWAAQESSTLKVSVAIQPQNRIDSPP